MDEAMRSTLINFVLITRAASGGPVRDVVR